MNLIFQIVDAEADSIGIVHVYCSVNFIFQSVHAECYSIRLVYSDVVV